jgi:uncharacterized membrane protein
MSVAFVLFLILLILMIAVGGGKGAKSFFTLVLNLITLFFMFWLMTLGLDPLKVTVYGCIIISSITLFYINGFNKKTVSSLISVIIVVLICITLTFTTGKNANIQGFSLEDSDNISMFSLYVNLDFAKVVMCEMLIGLIGAIIDVSISISSSMNEIFINNELISKGSLLSSGINIGKDILGTMTNTLLFAYIGGFMTLIIWFHDFHYSVPDILNAKVFCAEVFQVLESGIGIILIIPITAAVTSGILFLKSPFKKDKLKAKV